MCSRELFGLAGLDPMIGIKSLPTVFANAVHGFGFVFSFVCFGRRGVLGRFFETTNGQEWTRTGRARFGFVFSLHLFWTLCGGLQALKPELKHEAPISDFGGGAPLPYQLRRFTIWVRFFFACVSEAEAKRCIAGCWKIGFVFSFAVECGIWCP